MALPTDIKKPFILLVEGKDEELFFGYYQEFLTENFGNAWANLDKLQIISYDGISKLENILITIQTITGSEKIRKIGIIRDAENDADSGFNETKKALKAAKLDVPRHPLIPTIGDPVISVLIIPNHGAGSLEIIFLESVKDDPAFPCVTQYIACLSPIYERELLPKPKNVYKTKLHAFLSSRKEANISIGGAAQNGYWDFNNSAFDQIKSFLKELVT